MATGTVPAILPPPPPAPADSRERELIIQRQLGRTGLHLRLVDLGGSLAVWAIGVLLFFLAVALADHWIGLGIAGRILALVLLLAGTAYFLAVQVVPLVVRTINPTYAARTIEEATPALKNSLINFLLLRQSRSGIREIIYQAVERRAASDIADVPVEATVDRTHLLRAGYVLCGVMAVFAAYKILSPKDPFQTVARVLAPWADIARPSRVQISDVQPANAEVFYGQPVKISAAIAGIRSSDTVKLLYSTIDGQTVDRPVEMIAEVGGRYECTLPPAAGGGSPIANSSARGGKVKAEKTSYTGASGGLQQDVTYRIVAGDAESRPHRLTVITAPTIIVERLEYAFPSYTKRPPESVPQQGDIKAIEGTKVTIHAVANQPIKSAWLEFDPSTGGATPESVPLVAEGTLAHGTITLQLKPDRQSPWHATYQVRYYNERQDKSRQPILHKIDVICDLPPEVQILQPQKLRVEVPQDGEQLIEIRAVDPDFALSAVRIEGSVGGKPAVNADLLEDGNSKRPPQVSVLYAFRPREHKLAVGDELKYVAVAEDNRTGPTTGKPEPNVTRTAEYTLVVVAPQQNDPAQGNPNQQQKPGDPQNKQGKAAGSPPKADAKGADKKQNPPGADQKNNQQPRQPDQKDQQQKKSDNGQGQPEKAGGQKGKQDQGDKQQKGQQGQEKGQNQQGQQGQEKGQEKGQEQGQQQEGNQQGQSQQGKTPEGGQSGSQQDQSQQGQSEEGSSGKSSAGGSQEQGSSSGSQGENGSQRNAGGQAAGERQQPSGQPGDQQTDASNQPGGASGSKSKAAHDGDAIEQVYKELQKQKEGEQSQGQQSKTSEGQQQPGTGQEKAEGQGQQPKDQGQPGQGEKSTGQPKSDPAGNGAGKQGEKSGSEAGGKPQASGKSGAQGQNTPEAGQPGGNDQKPDPMGKGQPTKEKAGDVRDRLPDDKQGQNPSEQPGNNDKGGAPQGPSKTDHGEKSEKTKSEPRDPGAAQNGDEGAGTPGQEKTGSGEGTRENKDHPKTQQPDSSKSEQGSPSSPSNSKQQSDSKGGQEGDENGSGKQGGGQPSKQKGHDSAGSQSAADQGAGKANETGAGETGDKAGAQQQAADKTGKSGDQKGEGSAARADKHGDKASDSGQPSQDGSKSGAQQGQKSNPNQQGSKGSGNPTSGGGGDGQRQPSNPEAAKSTEVADAANLEYARKATEMVLRKLKDEEHNPDPELLDKLGWTREDLAEFLRRWDALQKTAQETPSGKREMDEALRSLGLRDPANRKRSGGTASDNQRDLRDGGNRSAPPSKYRDLFDAFRKGAARSRE